MDIRNAEFMKEFRKITTYMYNHNWHEKNGGNMSLLLREDQVSPYLDLDKAVRILLMPANKFMLPQYFQKTMRVHLTPQHRRHNTHRI